MIAGWAARPGALLGAVLLVGLAGCGGPASPPAPSTPPPASAPASPSGPVLPARPAELRMDGVQPCALLTDAQRAQLKVETGQPSGNHLERGSGECLWTNFPEVPDNHWLARAFVKRGADYALGSVTDVQVVQVDGFPAVQTSSPQIDPKKHCLLLVDVAAGQSLWVQYFNQRGDYPGISHEKSCELAREVATMSVRTLRTLSR